MVKQQERRHLFKFILHNRFMVKAVLGSFMVAPGLLAPKPLDHVDFRFVPSPMEISIDRASPAYSALEDSRLAVIDEQSNPNQAHVISAGHLETLALTSGATYSASPKEEVRIIATSRELKGLTLNRVVGAYPDKKMDLSPRQVTRLKVAGVVFEKTEPVAPSLHEVAQVLVQQELDRRKDQKLRGVRELRTSEGGSILVSRVPSTAPTERPRVISNSKKVLLAKNERAPMPRRVLDVPVPTASPTVSPAATASGPLMAASFLNMGGGVQSGITAVSGHFRFAGGAAFAPGRDQLYVYQEYDHALLKEGTVSEKDGFYRIDLQNMQGELIAEVRSPEGALMAQSRMSLAAYFAAQNTTGRVADLDLILTPAMDEVALRVAPALPDKDFDYGHAGVEIEGIRRLAFNKKVFSYKDESIVRPSTFLARAEYKDYMPTLSLAASGGISWLTLYPKVFFEKLMNVLNPDPRHRREDSTLGSIFGMASLDGQPMAGAVVDLLSRQDENVVYMDGETPQPQWISTGSSGKFIIPNLQPGLEILKVSQIGSDIMPVLVAVEKGHISQANIQVSGFRELEFNVFDGVSGAYVPAYINVVGTPDVFETDENGLAVVSRRRVSGTSLVEVDPGEGYAVSRVQVTDRVVLSKIPVFAESWLADVTNKATFVPPEDRNRLAIGYVQGDTYEVMLADSNYRTQPQIIYFNPDGSVRAEPWGVSDGGYVIVGLDAGLQTITIIPEKSKSIITRNLVIDDRAIDTSIINLGY